jgi:uncharacterized membrane protein
VTQELVVIAVDSTEKAQELLLAAGRLAADGKLGIDDAVVLSKSADGNAHKLETTDLTPIEGGVGGAFWGLFLGTLVLGPVGGLVAGAVTGGAGALLAKVVDRGISDSFTKEMESLLEPGHAAVCILTNYEDSAAVLAELNRFEGKVIWSNLPTEAVDEINRALEAGDVEHAFPVDPPSTSPA